MKRTVSLAITILTVAVASTGCGGDAEGSRPTVQRDAVTTAPATATSAPTTTASPDTSAAPRSNTTLPATVAAPPTTRSSAPLSASSRLRIDGIGPIDVGMTVAQARSAAGVELSMTKEPYCDVLTAPRGPTGVSLVVTEPASGRIELVIVNGGPVATVSGIRVGSTEAEVLAAYPGRLRTVNPSMPVHRLIYQATDPALADRVLVFVIDSSRVATMYAGVRNQAEADEICG